MEMTALSLAFYQRLRFVALRSLVGTLLVLLVALPLCSQTERGNITGQVGDPTGAAIPGAELTVTHVETNISTKTQSTSAGDYNVPVAPGVYRVTISAPGFKRYVRDHVTVLTASSIRLDVVLELGEGSRSEEHTSELQSP